MERLHCSVSAPGWPFPVYCQLSNQVTAKEMIECDWDSKGQPVLRIVIKKKQDQEHRSLHWFPQNSSWNQSIFSESHAQLSRIHRQTHTLSHGCAGSTTTAPSSGKEAHSTGSYDSAFGFSARPPVHLWGTWDSSASTTSLISTCQAASCCGWIQGMSGAMSRSHLKWQDENEGQGLAYGAD